MSEQRPLEWGDDLGQAAVTPEAWEGGIIAFRGEHQEWEQYPEPELKASILVKELYSDPQELYDKLRTNYRPIFPPRGWAGKTDAELWREMLGVNHMTVAAGFENPNDELSVMPLTGADYESKGFRRVDYSFNAGVWAGCGYVKSDELPALILALQNAQVLARRLHQ